MPHQPRRLQSSRARPVESHAPQTPAARKPASSWQAGCGTAPFQPAGYPLPRPQAGVRRGESATAAARSRRATPDSADLGARPASSRNRLRARPPAHAGLEGCAQGTNGKQQRLHGTASSGNGATVNGAALAVNGALHVRERQSSARGHRSKRNGHQWQAEQPASRAHSATSAKAGHAQGRMQGRRAQQPQTGLAAGAKAGNSKRFGFTARPKQGTKKRG